MGAYPATRRHLPIIGFTVGLLLAVIVVTATAWRSGLWTLSHDAVITDHQDEGAAISLPHYIEQLMRPVAGARNEYTDAPLVGGYQRGYIVEQPFPAQRVIDDILLRLESLNWKPMDYDWLNPGVPTSHKRGWHEYRGGIPGRARHFHEWDAHWQNKDGDIVSYTFQYSYALGENPNLNTLSVYCAWYPFDYVTSMKEAVQLTPISEFQ